MFYWFEHKQVYHPSRRMELSGAELGRPWEDVSFQAADGTALNGWWFPTDPPPGHKPKAVLLCHGNAGNISHRLGVCQALLDLGLSVFVFDYRGYGRSSGHPSESGTYRDAEAACQWLRTKGFSDDQVVLFGESLGGGIAAELAMLHPVSALVLVSTFTSVPAVGAELFPWLPVRWISRIRYDTVRKLPRVRVPVLIMHSPDDRLIGYHHAQALFAAANSPKMLWDLAGDHNDMLESGSKRFQDGLRKFFDFLNERPRAAAPR
jgi:pimeloyl-ACP methyl ester carboxylesterase